MSEFLIYQTEKGATEISVLLEDETVWLNQRQLSELFGKSKTSISDHIVHILENEELIEDSLVRYIRTTAVDGKSYEVAFYNLDMVIVA